MDVSVCAKEERERSVQRLSEQECTAVVRAVYTGTEQCECVCSE